MTNHSRPNPHSTIDEDFLDEAFAAALELTEAGKPVVLQDWIVRRPDLAPRLATMAHLARTVVPGATVLPDVPGYEPVCVLGTGGMGTVYLCRQTAMGGRLVALKVLHGARTESGRWRARFREEAQTLARLRHPGLVDVYEIVEPWATVEDGQPGPMAFSMVWVPGASVQQIIDRCAEVDRHVSADELARLLGATAAASRGASYVATVCGWIASVARTLHATHQAGVLHRDVKPSNILIRSDGAALLADFGVCVSAERTEGDTGFAGTPAYAAPEYREGGIASVRSEVFSLGATLYHALTLRMPFGASGENPLVPPRAAARELSRDLEHVILRAINPRPEDRYATASDFADDLDRLLSLKPVTARPRGVWGTLALALRRQRRVALASLLGVCAAVLACALMLFALWYAPRRADHFATQAHLALLHPAHANALWNIEWFDTEYEPGDGFRLDPAARDRAIKAYDAALAWGPWGESSRRLRQERALLLDPHAPAPDDRLRGFAAYVQGDTALAADYWSAFAAQTDPDPFVEAALGIVHLVRNQPALAYPRLETARAALPNVGFLAVYHADAAAGAGDLARASRLLDEAVLQPNHDHLGAAQRVRADLLLASGKLDDALSAYRSISKDGPLTAERSARVFALRQDHTGVLDALDPFMHAPRVASKVRSRYVTALEGWWNGLSAPARLHECRIALDRGSFDPKGLHFRLRAAGFASRPETAATLPIVILRDFATLRSPQSHASFERITLVEVARRLEVSNMHSWNHRRSFTPLLKQLQTLAWASPMPRTTSALLLRAHAARMRRLAAIAIPAFAGLAQGQSVFVPIGDLPGGLNYSIVRGLSIDGSTVVGSSKSAASAVSGAAATEAFRWRASTGMIALGDVPGDRYSSRASSCSADGEVVVGDSAIVPSSGTEGMVGFRWTQATGMVSLGDPPGGETGSYGIATTADGSIVFGAGMGPLYTSTRWMQSTGTVSLGLDQFLGSVNSISACSADGQFAAGGTGINNMFIWRSATGPQLIGDLPGGPINAYSHGVSGDGTTVVGSGTDAVGLKAVIWTQAAGLTPLPVLPGNTTASVAYRVSYDASYMVGRATVPGAQVAVIWGPDRVPHRLDQWLTTNGVAIPAGWQLTAGFGVQVLPSGTIALCGDGINPQGIEEAWYATVNLCTPAQAPTLTDRSVGVGQTIALSAAGASGSPPYTYQWRKDGVPLSNSANVFGSDLEVLTILSGSPADSGAYDVVVTNACSNATSNAATLSIGPGVCDDIDFNNDTSVFDPCDIYSFLLVFSEGPCTPCGE